MLLSFFDQWVTLFGDSPMILNNQQVALSEGTWANVVGTQIVSWHTVDIVSRFLRFPIIIIFLD